MSRRPIHCSSSPRASVLARERAGDGGPLTPAGASDDGTLTAPFIFRTSQPKRRSYTRFARASRDRVASSGVCETSWNDLRPPPACTECDVRARPSMLMPRSDSAAASECAEALDTLAARSTSSACRTSKRTLPRCSSPASRRYTSSGRRSSSRMAVSVVLNSSASLSVARSGIALLSRKAKDDGAFVSCSAESVWASRPKSIW
mmetsp:Transcript_37223/g.81842  ORF Transcript_37223/g.81842 Transcript_37223/m.81842 type:complete len:204 (+) Transcript_37223:208-819(+)